MEDAPIVKYLRWFGDSNKHVVSMAFDDESRWLMCLTVDQTLALIPLYYLLRPKQTHAPSISLSNNNNNNNNSDASNYASPFASSSALSSSCDTAQSSMSSSSNARSPPTSPLASAPSSGSSTPKTTSYSAYTRQLEPLDDVTIINLPSKQKNVKGVHCAWWKTWEEPSQFYGIVVTSRGQIRFINLFTLQEEKTTFTLDDDIQSIQVANHYARAHTHTHRERETIVLIVTCSIDLECVD
jgi:hypothetical protein